MLLPILQQELEQRLSEFRGDVGAVAAGAAVVDLTGVVALATEGVTQIGSDTPVAETDAWHIGSCTKMFTALTMATLIEDGRLDWGTTLANVFTDVGSVDSSWRRVTIEDLLQCRAGIRANIPISEMGAAHRCEDQLSDQRTTLAQSVLAAPSHNPGRFVYSNVGYILAGAAIDRLANTPHSSLSAMHVLRSFEEVPPWRTKWLRRPTSVSPSVGRCHPIRRGRFPFLRGSSGLRCSRHQG